MKHLKMFALAAAAVGVFMAFAGTSSSSALVWCTENKNPCPKAKTVLIIIESQVKPGKISNTSGTTLDECMADELETAEDKQGSGIPITAEIKALTWSGCTGTTDTIKTGSMEVTEISGTSNGTVILKGTEITGVLAGLSCTYGAGAGTDVGTLESSGEEGFMNMSGVFNKTSGSILCPADVQLQEKWKITNHKVVYVVSEGE